MLLPVLLAFFRDSRAACATDVVASNLDDAVFADWSAGQEQSAGLPKDGAKHAFWTKETHPEWDGVLFGGSKSPGVRQLRIGFHEPIVLGSVLVRGTVRLGALKAGVAYPGRLDHDEDWIAATRLKGGAVIDEETGRDEYAVWSFPAGLSTRAFRFTHSADATDANYAGWLGGALVLPTRVGNIAPQAAVSASASDDHAGRLTDSKEDTWGAWDNGKEGAVAAVSAAHPETIMLVWQRPVVLSGLLTFWTGFGAGGVEEYVGSADHRPASAPATDWKTVGKFTGLENGYPGALWPNALKFDHPVTVRAIRLRITAPTNEGHPHLHNNTREGRRVWLGELMAMTPLGDGGPETVAPKPPADGIASAAAAHPPIAIPFELPQAGLVTLVVEDKSGHRIRNLVAETPFPEGKNIAWWDGTNDLGRDRDAARHGIYHIPEAAVEPGAYRVRGLWHKGLDLRYEFAIYNGGDPAWETEDKTGGWLTNHTPPQAALFIPGEKAPAGAPMVLLGSAVSEGGAGLAWVDLTGKKLGGRGWVGGNWTAAPYLARDAGEKADPEIYAFVGSTWTSSSSNEDKTHGELRITGLTAKGDRVVAKHPFVAPALAEKGSGDGDWIGQLGGLAVHNRLLFASLSKLDKVLVFDIADGKVAREIAVRDPRGLACDARGALLALAGNRLLRFATPESAPETLVGGLLDPRGIAIDSSGAIYISDRGASNQVKVFSAAGKPIRAIGHAGEPWAGRYDPEHMNNPHGITIDSDGNLWVTENDFQPKRVSVWSPDGKLLRAFYGPSRYGGGGTLDPRDKTRFYYDGMEFKLDWKTGANAPAAVLLRSGQDNLNGKNRGAPETPIYVGDRQYMTNCYNSNPTGGAPIVDIWLLKDRVAAPVAAVGRANDWDLLKTDEYKPRWPEGGELRGNNWQNQAFFIWSDLNGDGKPQPEEVMILKAAAGGACVMPDLAVTESQLGGRAVRFAVKKFTPGGAPIYDIAGGEVLAEGAQAPASSGGDQALVSADGWTVLTVGSKPYAPEGFSGVRNGEALWQYPSVWPGLHASHEAGLPERAGEVIGSTRLLGGFVTPAGGSDAGPLWCINGNMGNMYLFTADGLVVSELFRDVRAGKPWTMPRAERNMRMNGVSLHDENFFPTISQAQDGTIYVCDGARTTLIRLDGVDSIRRFAAADVEITGKNLAQAQEWRIAAEAARQRARGSGMLTVRLRHNPPVVDGKLDDWNAEDFVPIDRRGVGANFDSNSKPYDVTGAVSIAGDRLYAAWRTQDPELLKNSGETPNALFKTGGCLDLMIGGGGRADPARTRPVEGDERLLVSLVAGKTRALLYRPVAPGTKDPVPFSSPSRTVSIDRVDDVSAEAQLASSVERDEQGRVKSAFYEISVPLSTLGLRPETGAAIKGDIGILRGNGFQTLQRVYWNNKATGITADVPSEAELTPQLWGSFLFKE